MGGMSLAAARNLRGNLTDAERVLWKHLGLRQIEGDKFRRQHMIGSYVVDFVCLERRLIIEVDGGQHDMHTEKDDKRTAWLESERFRVTRFWNNDVLRNIEAVRTTIRKKLVADPPYLSPPPPGGRRSESNRQ